MVKLIIQKKKRYNNNKKFSLLGKSSRLNPLVPNPGIGTWYSRFCGKSAVPLVRQFWGGDIGRFIFLLSLILWAIRYKQEL
jgi:hypothetical protein